MQTTSQLRRFHEPTEACFGITALALAGVLVISGCSASTGTSDGDEKPLTVGVLLPLTGSLAALGNEMYNGYKVAQAMINESGGINGQKSSTKLVMLRLLRCTLSRW